MVCTQEETRKTLGRACRSADEESTPRDIVVLDAEHERMIGHSADTALDAFVFSAGRAAVRDVWAASAANPRGAREICRARNSPRGRIRHA